MRYYRSLGIRFVRVLTDNGVAYRSRKFQRLCRRLGIKHKRTRPYTPRTNGKAERFIQTALREWAYARRYESSSQRIEHLPGWLHRYNWHRPHSSLGYLPPVSRLKSLNNLVGLHRRRARLRDRKIHSDNRTIEFYCKYSVNISLCNRARAVGPRMTPA